MRDLMKFMLWNIIYYIFSRICLKILSDITFDVADNSIIYIIIVCLVNIISIILVKKRIIKPIYIIGLVGVNLVLMVAALNTLRPILSIVTIISFIISFWVYYKMEIKNKLKKKDI